MQHVLGPWVCRQYYMILPTWCRSWTTSCGAKWYKLLCEQYTKVSAVFHRLKPEHQEVRMLVELLLPHVPGA